jgi:1,4-alpha-glucan branching enzyme
LTHQEKPLPHLPSGFVSLVLHCHLPFVRHPEHEYFLEENWYYEAVFETYLPLLEVFEELENKKVPFSLTLSVSPTLLSMCLDPLLQKRALRYVDQLLALVKREKKRVGQNDSFSPAVQMYEEKLLHYRGLFVKYHGNVAEGFKRFQDLGRLELITCAATHGFLPLLRVHESAVRAQIEIALQIHRDFFGKAPLGFWLPECAYEPGMDKILKEYGIQFTFLETHGVLQATPHPRFGTFAPVVCPSGLTVFGRDLESSKQVWSAQEGYPGDPVYREFYRDIGYDLSAEELHPYLQPEGFRRFTGLKYYRITGDTDQKEPYHPQAALDKAKEHAGDFLSRRRRQAEEASRWMDRPPLMTCLYDAELFGHWWYEGPSFIQELFEQNAGEEKFLRFITPSDYLKIFSDNQSTQPVFSTWGVGGYSEFWLNESNDWIYPPLNSACAEMIRLADLNKAPKKQVLRALNQAVRELLLAQSSDWAFMMKAGRYAPYAEQRIKIHLNRFYQLADSIRAERVLEAYLSDLEEKDNLFQKVDYGVFKKQLK